MKIPNTETIVVSYSNNGIKDYCITKNSNNGKYTLYKILENGFEKIKTAETPLPFDAIVEKKRGEDI